MDITPEDVSLARSPVELPLSGLICNIRECQDSDNLCVLRLPSTSTVDQRLFEELDYFLRKAVPGSFLEHDTTHFAAANQAPSAGNTHDAQLIVRSLVSTDSPTGPTALSSPPPRIFDKKLSFYYYCNQGNTRVAPDQSDALPDGDRNR
ncbi:hypothetical protein CU097_003527 [Rhizopus azygosporus]|uniref:Uncharacterized protein n=1 Tax=Rhizopus azygosporus TaxID=86630 RepID=A0A367J377_RHIAZ|nr:hypothetical protein CU097_003527 [Rhizopus azygosporus]